MPTPENTLSLFGETPFESIKHYDEELGEYWLARELMPLLAYKKWQDFNRVINKAITACKPPQRFVKSPFYGLA
jgi:DNA-damage-inducible protein D